MNKIFKKLEVISNEELGKLLKEYVSESNWNEWEGFNKNDMVGIRKMMRDMILYKKMK